MAVFVQKIGCPTFRFHIPTSRDNRTSPPVAEPSNTLRNQNVAHGFIGKAIYEIFIILNPTIYSDLHIANFR